MSNRSAGVQTSSRDDTARGLGGFESCQEQPFDLKDRERPAEQESLHLSAAFGRNFVALFRGFHAFGCGGHAHSSRKRRDGSYDIEGAGTFRNVFYERPVNLDLVERKALKISQR